MFRTISLIFWPQLPSCIFTLVHQGSFTGTVGNHEVIHDVLTWKYFPHYWPFVRGIHQSQLIPLTRDQTQSFGVIFDASPNTLLNKHLSCQWFEMPWCSCDVTVIMPEFVKDMLRIRVPNHNKRQQSINHVHIPWDILLLTHWGWVTHICISK